MYNLEAKTKRALNKHYKKVRNVSIINIEGVFSIVVKIGNELLYFKHAGSVTVNMDTVPAKYYGVMQIIEGVINDA